MSDDFVARYLGCRPLPAVWEEMKRFTAERSPDTRDEVWFVEHPAIYTLGLNGNAAHVLDAGDIPVLKVDRGGQVTYHGPGQLVAYTLLDLARLKLGIRSLVEALERAVVDTAAEYGVEAQGRRDAPGVYVNGCKLAALGLKISRQCSYHGIALNVDMDLEPYSGINPCGFEALPVTDLRSLCGVGDIERVRGDLERNLRFRLSGN
ncbi:MAG: lipoyl(octanoyl) transferase LipB [Gammaproteobacteria bacterium]|nr:lipoyl(octanoyl) transferase LipB [Rhodospirillaceae bacterium]MDE0062068.1 lipoyl(octanoyl) transferase LipB [Gammaproteobacteria bacterium]